MYMTSRSKIKRTIELGIDDYRENNDSDKTPLTKETYDGGDQSELL